VLPCPPADVAQRSEEDLAQLVTRDHLIGVRR
jgi:hypothetical protein